MVNSLVPIDGPKLPAHLANRARRTNIAPQETVPSLSFGGKVWTVNVGGERIKMMRESEGEQVPAQVMRVVILDWAKQQGRSLYARISEAGELHFTTFNPEKPTKPLCWSDNGVSADNSISRTTPLFGGWTGSCQSCPMAAKGSRISDDGIEGVGCEKHRMLAVIPHNQLNGTPLRMRIAKTSSWDNRSPELAAQGWFAFDNLIKDLRAKGYGDTAEFVTKMKFDTKVNYPKIVFRFERWLSESEDAVVAPLAESLFVKGLLAGTWTPNGPDGVAKVVGPIPEDEDESDEIAAIIPRSVASQSAPTFITEQAIPTKRVTPKPKLVKPTAEPVQPQVAPPADEDEDEAPAPVTVAPKAAATKPAQKTAPVVASRVVPDNIADILNRWEPKIKSVAVATDEDDE